MKITGILIVLLGLNSLGFSQQGDTKIAIQLSNSFFSRVFENTHDLYNLTKIDIGIILSKEKANLFLYATYGYNTNLLLPTQKSVDQSPFSYKSNMLGGTVEYHLLSNKKRFRIYFGISVLSEVTSNYKDGYIWSDSFLILDYHSRYLFNGYYINNSNFYNSTPFLGTIYLGGDLRIVKNLHLNLSIGYSMRIMRYKYLEWYDNDDYQSMLLDTPMKTRMFHYINAQLGLRYAFSFKTKPKKE